jgi:nucleotide-binding universal stress UspA family protein
MLRIRKILCPVDPGEPSQEALRTAGELANTFGAELIVTHVVVPAPVLMAAPDAVVATPPSMEQEIVQSSEKSILQMMDQADLKGLKTRAVVLEGDEATEIIQTAEAENVDLIVIGTHGRTGLHHLVYGSLAEKLVRLAKPPVLVVKTSLSGTDTHDGDSDSSEKKERQVDIQTLTAAVRDEVKDLSATLDAFRIKLEDMTAQAKARYKTQVEDLRDRGEDVQKKLGVLKESGGEAWEEVKAGLSELKDALERAVAKFREEKVSPAEEAPGNERIRYEKQAEAELRELKNSIDRLRSWAGSSAAGAKSAYFEQVDALRVKEKAVKQKLNDLSRSGKDAWGDIRNGVQEALEDLDRAIKEAVAKFKK